MPADGLLGARMVLCAQADREEARWRAEQRRIQIERANKMLFDDSDRVRNFHSTVLMSDVIKENEALATFKQQIAGVKAKQEADFLAQRELALKAQDEKTAAQAEARRQQLLQQQAAQRQQLEDLKHRILAERAESKAEGEALRLKAQLEAEDMAAKERAARERAQAFNEETRRANDVLVATRRLEQERNAATMRAIAEYAAKKEANEAERARREAEIRAQKEARRMAMVAAIEANYNKVMAEEQSRLKADIEEREAKADADLAERQRKFKEMMSEKDRMNTLQLQVHTLFSLAYIPCLYPYVSLCTPRLYPPLRCCGRPRRAARRRRGVRSWSSARRGTAGWRPCRRRRRRSWRSGAWRPSRRPASSCTRRT